MLGDYIDMARRMRATLPVAWCGDETPILQAVLEGIGSARAACFTLLQACIQQSRISTATGSFLDLITTDFFDQALIRRPGESDNLFRGRILHELLRPRGTRAAVVTGLQQLTGNTPYIFEPARPSDTVGYTAGGLGFGVAGGWGNLNLPFQYFITIGRPYGVGIADLAGYATGGIPVYGSPAMEVDRISDAELFAAIPPLLPVGTIAWVRLAA
jgi:hypothetical protein